MQNANTEIETPILTAAKIIELTGAKYPDLAAKAASENWDEPRLAAEVKICDLQAARPKGPAVGGGGHDNAATTPEILAAAVLDVVGADSERLCGAAAAASARELRCSSLLDVIRASLSLTGRGIPRGGPSAILSAGFSSIDLAVALGDSAQKLVLDSYSGAPATWKSHAKVIDVVNFHPASVIRPTFAGSLKPVPAGGEVKHGTISEDTAKIAADTYAQLLTMDRKDIINDSGGIFMQTISALGKNAARSVSDLFYQTLLANADDFFHEDNGNLLTGGESVLSFESLAAATTLMRSQRDKDGRDLDIVPRVLVVPPELETTARQLLVSQSVARYTAEAVDNRPEGNPFKNLTLEVESRLSNPAFTGASDKGWYLFASPQDAATAVAFLNGNQAPIVETFTPSSEPTVLAYSWRVYLDFGAALVDHRAGVRADGE